MKLSIQKWGNGAAVRLQRPLLRQIQCEIGEALEVEVVDGGLFLRPTRKPDFSLDELLQSCTPQRVSLDDEDREWLESSPRRKAI